MDLYSMWKKEQLDNRLASLSTRTRNTGFISLSIRRQRNVFPKPSNYAFDKGFVNLLCPKYLQQCSNPEKSQFYLSCWCVSSGVREWGRSWRLNATFIKLYNLICEHFWPGSCQVDCHQQWFTNEDKHSHDSTLLTSFERSTAVEMTCFAFKSSLNDDACRS